MYWISGLLITLCIQGKSVSEGINCDSQFDTVLENADNGERICRVKSAPEQGLVFWLMKSGQQILGVYGPFPRDEANVRIPPAIAPQASGISAQGVFCGVSGKIFIGSLLTLSYPLGGENIVLAVDGATPGTQDVILVDGDGVLVGPVSFLQAIVIDDLILGSVGEERRFRRDVPRSVTLRQSPQDTGKTAVQLPDRSTIIFYRKSNPDREGLARIYRDGVVELIWEEPVIEIGESAIAQIVGASDYGPYFGFLVQDGLELKEYRTDGQNWPGGGLVRDVTPSGATDLEEESIAFGQDVMTVVDEDLGAFLIPHNSGPVIQVSLPPSGGLIPSVFDEQFAVSGDGRTFAFGAGRDDKIKDVYVIRDDGAALNITQSIADYEEVGYFDPDKILKMALSFDGGLVSYIDSDSFPEDECFVAEVLFPSPELITSSVIFFDSIDIGSVVRFIPDNSILVTAGVGLDGVDLFASPTAQDTDIFNLTLSSPLPNPPFGKFARLRTPDIGSIDGGTQFLVTAIWRTGLPSGMGGGPGGGPTNRLFPHTELLAIDSIRGTCRVVAAEYNGLAAPIRNSNAILAIDKAHVVIADPTDPSIGYKSRWPMDSTPVDFSIANASTAVLLGDVHPGDRAIFVMDLNRGVTRQLTAPLGAVRDIRVDLGGAQAWFVMPMGGPNSKKLARYRLGPGVELTSIEGVQLFLQGE